MSLKNFVLFIALCLSPAHFIYLAAGYGAREQLWFEVLHPSDVAFAYKIRSARDFGGVISRPLHHINLVATNPDEACGDIIDNGADLKGQIALIKRGGCSFVTKCVNVELYGAIAAIIADNDPNDNSEWVEMIGDGTNREGLIGIPSFYMLGKDGHMISDSLKRHNIHSAVINIPVNYTHGAIINQPPWNFW